MSLEPAEQSYQFSATLKRHQPRMPIYLLVPESIVKGIGLSETFVVEADVNGQPIGRRSVKPWGESCWFMEVNQRQCQRVGVTEGDEVKVLLTETPQEPGELIDAIAQRGLLETWERLTNAQRRSLGEPVFEAKRSQTRLSRIKRAIDCLTELAAQTHR